MAKKIRFPLIMNGTEVRTIEELQENFDLESVLGYFANGKLTTWLRDRYYDMEATEVEKLNPADSGLNSKLCNILGVKYAAEEDETDLEAIRIRNEKLMKLKQLTSDQKLIDSIDVIAFSQDELFDILDTDTDVVYLCGDQFSISPSRRNVRYIGVNCPLVKLNNIDKSSYEDYGITFDNVEFEKHVVVNTYPDPIGEFEIEDGILKKGLPSSDGVCIIPYGVTAIADNAFNDQEALSRGTEFYSITIPDTVVSISYKAFRLTQWFRKQLSESPYVIINNIFLGGDCYSGNVVIPDGVKIIGDYAFSNCYCNLTGVTIPDTVTNIGKKAFEYCGSLIHVTLPESLETIGEEAFSCCNLSEISIPNSVTTIGDRAFFCCKNLQKVHIPDSVTSIGKYAFSQCECLEYVNLPNRITCINDGTFRRCLKLETIFIPNNVTRIGNSAFEQCFNLTMVKIPDSVTIIDEEAFRGCTSLDNIIIPSSVIQLGKLSFCGCYTLKDVFLPPNISIGCDAFIDTSWGNRNRAYLRSKNKSANKKTSNYSDPLRGY